MEAKTNSRKYSITFHSLKGSMWGGSLANMIMDGVRTMRSTISKIEYIEPQWDEPYCRIHLHNAYILNVDASMCNDVMQWMKEGDAIFAVGSNIGSNSNANMLRLEVISVRLSAKRIKQTLDAIV